MPIDTVTPISKVTANGTVIPLGSPAPKEYFLKVVDIDGEMLYETTLDNGETFDLSTLDIPVHDRLTFDTWVSSEQIVNNTVTVDKNDIMVGPTYVTTSGKNEFDIELTENTGLTVNIKAIGTIEWGDGTSETSSSAGVVVSHTYSTYGKYMITTTDTQFRSRMLNQSDSLPSGINFMCVAIRAAGTVTAIQSQSCARLPNCKYMSLPRNAISYNQAFQASNGLKALILPQEETNASYNCTACWNLKHVVIPYGWHKLQASFQAEYSLEELVIPKSVTSIQNNSIDSCSKITRLILPDSVTVLGNATSRTAISYCYNLEYLKLPENMTTGDYQNISWCSKLKIIVMPKYLTTINQQFIRSSSECLELMDFRKATSVPSLAETNYTFQNINTNLKIVVPDSLYEEWIATANWSTIAGNIYKASEVQI